MASKYFKVMLGVLCTAPIGARAQLAAVPQVAAPDATVPVDKADATEIVKIIRMKYVPVEVMAWWIDREHNAEPEIYGRSRNLLEDYGNMKFNRSASASNRNDLDRKKTGDAAKPQKPVRGGLFELRAKIIPDVAHGELRVEGTAEQIGAVEAIVGFLDKPLRSVEVEVQFADVSRDDAKNIGFDQGSNSSVALHTNPNGGQPTREVVDTMKIGFARTSFQGELARLVAQKRARLLAPPRVTVVNNLTAVIEVVRHSVAGEIETDGEKMALKQKASGPLAIETRIATLVTPTINNDDTVTVVLSTSKTRWLAEADPFAAARVVAASAPGEFASEKRGEVRIQAPANALQSVANVRDGETIIVSGFTADFWPDTIAADRVLLLLVRPRLVPVVDASSLAQP